MIATILTILNITTVPRRIDVESDMEGFLAGNIGAIVSHWVTVAMVLAFVLLLAQTILTGYQWMAAANDPAKLEAARRRFIFSFVGLTVAVSVYAIYSVVSLFLGVGSEDVVSSAQLKKICNETSGCQHVGGDCGTTTCSDNQGCFEQSENYYTCRPLKL